MNAIASGAMFHRLVDVLLPKGGTLAVMFEAYFDESGDLDNSPHVFCVAGYYILAENAKEMHDAWQSVLDEHEIKYFRMSECAPGNGEFEGIDKDKRDQCARKLIALIKKHTLSGFATVCRGENFNDPDVLFPNAYSLCGYYCISHLDRWLTSKGLSHPVSYFFESGHKHGKGAQIHLSKYFSQPGRSVSLVDKKDVVLLQAADLLAWQCAKNVKNRISGEHPIRQDFLSLMKHPHEVVNIELREDKVMALVVETWPLSSRPESKISFRGDFSGPVPLLYQPDDEGFPIVPTLFLKEWKAGPFKNTLQLVYKHYGPKKERGFSLIFDHQRIVETIMALIQGSNALNVLQEDYVLRPAAVQLEKGKDGFVLQLIFSKAVKIGLLITNEAAMELVKQINELPD